MSAALRETGDGESSQIQRGEGGRRRHPAGRNPSNEKGFITRQSMAPQPSKEICTEGLVSLPG